MLLSICIFFSIFFAARTSFVQPHCFYYIFGLWSRAHHKLYGMEKWRDSDSGINAHAACNKWHTISCAILATRYVLSGRCFWATLDKNISLKECLVWRGKIQFAHTCQAIIISMVRAPHMYVVGPNLFACYSAFHCTFNLQVYFWLFLFQFWVFSLARLQFALFFQMGFAFGSFYWRTAQR